MWRLVKWWKSTRRLAKWLTACVSINTARIEHQHKNLAQPLHLTGRLTIYLKSLKAITSAATFKLERLWKLYLVAHLLAIASICQSLSKAYNVEKGNCRTRSKPLRIYALLLLESVFLFSLPIVYLLFNILFCLTIGLLYFSS